MQRGDGRWQVHIRHTDEDGRSGRYTVYGSTPKEARAKAGLRRGEALALHWSDIDLDAKLLRVRGTLARVAGQLVVTKTRRRGLAEWSPLPHCGAAVARRTHQSESRAAEGRLNVAANPVCVHNRAGRVL